MTPEARSTETRRVMRLGGPVSLAAVGACALGLGAGVLGLYAAGVPRSWPAAPCAAHYSDGSAWYRSGSVRHHRGYRGLSIAARPCHPSSLVGRAGVGAAGGTAAYGRDLGGRRSIHRRVSVRGPPLEKRATAVRQVVRQLCAVHSGGSHHFTHDVLGLLPRRLGVEVHDDPVPQHGSCATA